MVGGKYVITEANRGIGDKKRRRWKVFLGFVQRTLRVVKKRG
jgi:hypothetical protein